MTRWHVFQALVAGMVMIPIAYAAPDLNPYITGSCGILAAYLATEGALFLLARRRKRLARNDSLPDSSVDLRLGHRLPAVRFQKRRD